MVVNQNQDNFCVNVVISPDDVVEQIERLHTQVMLLVEGINGNLEQVDEANCELILVIDDDGM